jgi:MFS transporter, DHA1 family, multidrug resistance protein
MLKPEVSPYTPPKAGSGKLGLVLIIGALSAFGPLSIDMYLPGLPSLSRELGGPTWQVQLTLTACLLGLAGGQVVVGPLSDTMGRRKPLLIGLFTYAVASLLCAVAPSTPFLILFRLIQGAAGAAGIVISRAIVRDHFSGNEVARFFALTMMINGAAPILAPVIGGQLLSFTSWRGIFLVLTAFGLALLAAAAFGLKESLPVERRRTSGLSETFGAFGILLSDRHFVGYALSAGLAFAAMFAYISGSPFVTEEIYHVSPQMFSLIFAVNALGIVVASQVSGQLVGRVEARKLLAFGLCTSLAGSLLLLVVVMANVGLVGILPAFFIVVASVGFISPNAAALALAEHPQMAGSASGLMGVSQFIIGAAVSPLVSIGGTGTALPLAIIMALVSTGGFLMFTLMTGNRVRQIGE